MQNTVAYDEIEFKPLNRSYRMGRSQAARMRRRELKQIRERRTLNEWARARRARKKAK